MPELPEVQTIVQDLRAKILHQKINKVEVRLKKIVKGSVAQLQNNFFTEIERRGKLIILHLPNEKYLLIHLRMTGQIILQQKNKQIAGGHSDGKLGDLPNKYTHVIITFANGAQLFFNDQRQFGWWQIVGQQELGNVLEKFGPEPLDNKFTFKIFQQILAGKKGNIKAFLLNQKNIAGLGNIYVDEILWRAKVRPTRKMDSLNLREVKAIFQAIKPVLRLAIKHRGTTFNDYVDADGKRGAFLNFLKVYGRAGAECLRCKKGIVKKIKHAGRGTHFCPKCQNKV